MRRGYSRVVVTLFLAGVLASCGSNASGGSAPRHIYWTTAQGTVARANLDGTAVDENFITPARPASARGGVAVDGTHIYWTSGSPNGATGTTIGRANLDGTGNNSRFITGADGPAGIAVDGTHIYWANYGGGGGGTSVGRANLDGTGVDENFITGAKGPADTAVDRSFIYWTNDSGDSIGRANLDLTSVTQNFIGGRDLQIDRVGVPAGVAVDGSHIYWADHRGQEGKGDTIYRANLDGTNASVVAVANGPGGVAIDGTYIYWTNDYGSIGRAKLNGSDVNQTFIVGGAGVGGTLTVGP